MRLEIIGEGAFQACRILLDAQERFTTEAGAMTRMSAGIDYEVSIRDKGTEGVWAAFERMLGNDSFFLAHYVARTAGEVVVAPTLMGQITIIELDGSSRWLCAGGSFLGCGPEVDFVPRYQGLKGLLVGQGLFFLEVSGRGPVILNGFGHIIEIEIDRGHLIDTGQIVAFEKSLNYRITKAGGSWGHSIFAGEGAVAKFSGHGKALIQTHSPSKFGSWIGIQFSKSR